MKIGRYFDAAPGPRPAPAVPRTRPQSPETLREFGPRSETAVDLLDPTTYRMVEALAADVREIARRATGQPLKSAEEAHQLTELLARAASAGKDLDRYRRQAVDPLNAQVKTINATFKPLTTAIENIQERGKRSLEAWLQQERARVERERREAERLAEEAAAREGQALLEADAAQTPEQRQDALARAEAASADQAAAVVAAPLPAPRVLKGEYGTAGLRKRWTFEVVKPEDVPRQYLTVDEKAIRAAVAGGVRQIPGVSITETEEIAVRAGG
ncbi:hypothetical protein [Longimicrobium sp.]|uniref:hypothetical protein n=1 Tax=Longimicrobium sp. TaxID=2029185 RepID=UPI002E34F413|nr:hypothetical protein [Longimicrobium sp.]HEX6038876.1 hypothetical protein [Longimicrobium sp.]